MPNVCTRPDAGAHTSGSATPAYAELSAQARALAEELRKAGVGLLLPRHQQAGIEDLFGK